MEGLYIRHAPTQTWPSGHPSESLNFTPLTGDNVTQTIVTDLVDGWLVGKDVEAHCLGKWPALQGSSR
jgi:hypothetical protein